MRIPGRVMLFTVVVAVSGFAATTAAQAAITLDPECSIRCVDVSANGEYVAIGWSTKVSVFRTGHDRPLWHFDTGGYVDNVVLSEDGQKLAVSYNDPPWPYTFGSRGHVAFFHTDSSTPVWTDTTDYPIIGMGRRAMDMSRDGSRIVAGTYLWTSGTAEHVGTLYVWDTANPVPVTYSYPNSVLGVRISGNGEYFAADTYWYNMRRYHIASGTYWSVNPGDASYGLALDHDGTFVATGHGWSGHVDLWRSDGSRQCTIPTGGTNSSIAMDDAGDYFVVSQYKQPWSGANGVWLFSTSCSDPIWFHDTGSDGQRVVDMSRDGSRMVCGGAAGDVALLDNSLAEPLYDKHIGEFVSDVAMSADGGYYAGVSWKGFLYLFRGGDEPKVEWIWNTPCPMMLCHVPPGNPGQAHTIVVDENAPAAHLTNHPGDYLGRCAQDGDRRGGSRAVGGGRRQGYTTFQQRD